MRSLVHAALVFSVTLFATRASAQSFDAIHSRGHALYAAGRYAEAAEAYQALVDAGVDDADVYFDLGTAWAGAARYGRAIVAFERALSLRPSDRGAEQSLANAEAMLARRRASREGEATTSHRGTALDALSRTFSERAWAVSLLAFSWVLFGALTALLFARREALRLALGIVATIGLGFVSATALGLAARRGAFHEGVPAVVLDEEVPMREAPDARAKVLGTAHEGDRAEMLESRDGYVRVRIVGRGRGWVASAEVGRYTTP